MGASATLIGANTAVAGVASIVTVPFVPRLAARIGVVPLLLASLALGAASLLAFKLVFSVAWWFPIRFAFSAALGALFALSEYWINAAAPPDRRGLAVGLYATVLAAGFALGPVLLAWSGTSGWPPYLVGAVLFGLGALPLLLGRGLSPALDGESRRSVWSFLTRAPALMLAPFVFGAVETGGFALLPVYGVRLGLSDERAAMLVSAVALGSVVLQVPLGLLSDRVDRRRLLIAASLAGAAGAGLIPVAANHGLALEALLLVWGGIGTALYTVALAELGSRFSGADLANGNAAFLVAYNLGLVVGPFLVGAAMDRSPAYGLAVSLAALFALYAILACARAASRP